MNFAETQHEEQEVFEVVREDVGSMSPWSKMLCMAQKSSRPPFVVCKVS